MGVYCCVCCTHLVRVCVLLNMSLYCKNRFCMNFVDFVAVNLVSCIVIIVGLLVISRCRFGRVVFSDAAFHVMICVLWFIIWVFWVFGGGVLRGVCIFI